MRALSEFGFGKLREAGDDPARRDSVVRDLLGQFRRIPGVRASDSQLGVFTGGESSRGIEVEGYAPKTDNDHSSAMDVIGPGYFSTLGVPIALGREILESDNDGAPKVCVITEAFAIGGWQIRWWASPGTRGPRACETTSSRATFVPAPQASSPVTSPTFLIRTATETAPVMTTVRKTIQRVCRVADHVRQVD
jgi:hypothetical protein